MTDPHSKSSNTPHAGPASPWMVRTSQPRGIHPPSIDGRTPCRHLGSLTIADRWLLLKDRREPRIGYRFHERPTPRAIARLRAAAGVHRPHTLQTESIIEDETRHVWLVTPYIGDAGGLISLDKLAAHRGGRLPVLEVTQAVHQIHAALQSIRDARLHHPDLTFDQILICHRGMLHIELPDAPDTRRINEPTDDQRTAAVLGAQLLTGQRNPVARTLGDQLTRSERRSAVARWIMNHLD